MKMILHPIAWLRSRYADWKQHEEEQYAADRAAGFARWRTR